MTGRSWTSAARRAPDGVGGGLVRRARPGRRALRCRISPALAELARRRLPQWADRIWTGNAVDWRPPAGLRFDYVHILLDSVPRARRADLVRHHLAHTVRPGTGRLLVSDYAADPAAGHPVAAETLRSLGFRCAGQTSGGTRPGPARQSPPPG